MQKHHRTSTATKSPLRRYITGTILFLVLFVVVWQAYLFLFPHARLNFTAYAPIGRHISNAEEVVYNAKLGFLDPDINITYDLPNERLWSYQEKSDTSEVGCNQELDAGSCIIYTTPTARTYLFATSVSPSYKDASGQPYTEQWVALVRGKTFIRISSKGSLHWTRQQWEHLIDSLEPAPFPNLPVRKIMPGP